MKFGRGVGVGVDLVRLGSQYRAQTSSELAQAKVSYHVTLLASESHFMT